MRHTSDRVLSPKRLAALQRDAKKLCSVHRSQRSVAKILGMNPGRFNHILRGNWYQVVITEADVIALRVARELALHDDTMSDEARSLAKEFDQDMGKLSATASRLLRALRRM